MGKAIVMNNIQKLQQALISQGLDAMIATDPSNRLYATGFASSAGTLLVTAHDAWFFTDSRYIEAARASVTGAHVHQSTSDEPVHTQIKTLLGEYGITAAGFEENSMTYSAHREWSEKLEIDLIPANKILSDLRAIKSPGDLEKMKESQRIAEKSFEEVLPLISTDMTEKQLAAELLYRFLLNGADDKSFDTIVVSGTKSSMPHGVPEDVKIGNGFLTIDFGVRFDGWCSDTTRTLCIGKPDDEMKRIYDTVLKAQEAGIKAFRAGVVGSAVDAAARSVIENAGYGEYFGHGFGHALGLEVHEPQSASIKSEDILPAGAVISAEPGIYIPGHYGVRIEDVVYVTENGCENITKLAKELIIL